MILLKAPCLIHFVSICVLALSFFIVAFQSSAVWKDSRQHESCMCMIFKTYKCFVEALHQLITSLCKGIAFLHHVLVMSVSSQFVARFYSASGHILLSAVSSLLNSRTPLIFRTYFYYFWSRQIICLG